MNGPMGGTGSGPFASKSPNGGNGGIITVTSVDGSVIVTNPTGPTVDLSIEAGLPALLYGQSLELSALGNSELVINDNVPTLIAEFASSFPNDISTYLTAVFNCAVRLIASLGVADVNTVITLAVYVGGTFGAADGTLLVTGVATAIGDTAEHVIAKNSNTNIAGVVANGPLKIFAYAVSPGNVAAEVTVRGIYFKMSAV